MKHFKPDFSSEFLALNSKLQILRYLTSSSIYFSVPTLILYFVNFISIPILLKFVELDDWSNFVSAQAIGAIFSAIVAFGWNISGPNSVSSLNIEYRIRYYTQSMVLRFLISIFMLPIGTFLTFLIFGFNLQTFIGYLGTALAGLSATWYFTGTGKPLHIVFLDTGPKTIVTLLGLLIAVQQQSLFPFACGVLGGVVISIVLSSINIIRKENLLSISILRIKHSKIVELAKYQFAPTLTALSGTMYTNLPITVIQSFFPNLAPVFNLCMKIGKFGIAVLIPLIQSFQGLMSKVSNKERLITNFSRYFFMIVISFGLLFGICSPSMVGILSHGQVSIGFLSALGISTYVICVCATQYLGLVILNYYQKRRDVAVSTLLGAVIAGPLISILTYIQGIEGAIFGVALIEMIILFWQLKTYLVIYRSFKFRSLLSGSKHE